MSFCFLSPSYDVQEHVSNNTGRDEEKKKKKDFPRALHATVISRLKWFSINWRKVHIMTSFMLPSSS